jgi:hypothetical protein
LFFLLKLKKIEMKDNLIKTLILTLFILNEYKNVSTAILRKRQTNELFDQQKTVGDSVTLECSLTDKYTNEVSWKKIDGVFFFFYFK